MNTNRIGKGQRDAEQTNTDIAINTKMDGQKLILLLAVVGLMLSCLPYCEMSIDHQEIDGTTSSEMCGGYVGDECVRCCSPKVPDTTNGCRCLDPPGTSTTLLEAATKLYNKYIGGENVSEGGDEAPESGSEVSESDDKDVKKD